MSAHRFRLEVAGQVVVGLAFTSEDELEDFLLGRGGLGESVAQAPPARSEPDEPRGRGRPSHAAVIAAAVAALGAKLGGRQSLAQRTNFVLEQLAETREASEIPGRSTVERYLSSLQKSPQKSKRARISRKGG